MRALEPSWTTRLPPSSLSQQQQQRQFSRSRATTAAKTTATAVAIAVVPFLWSGWIPGGAVSAWAQPPFWSVIRQQQQQQQQQRRRRHQSYSTTGHDLASSETRDTMPTTSTTTSSTSTVLAELQAALNNSWIQQLSSETPENLQKSRQRENLPATDDNRSRRPVYNGHYVIVQPTGLPSPRFVLWSDSVAKEMLHLDYDHRLEELPDVILAWLSGNRVLAPNSSWATPYALSIMGTRYTNNCPYGTGHGYGDGRAIAIGELYGYELQLKGAGKTPFHRGADGRAVLRSSLREFLASEAMHHLRVSTTRALSLVVSETETVARPWYTDDAKLSVPTLDDPRLQRFPLEQRKLVIQQIRQQQKADPNSMVLEPAAMTCRVAPSFVRIGHIDLFARRVEQQRLAAAMNNKKMNDHHDHPAGYDTSTLQWKELEQMIWHACYREFRTEAYDPYIATNDLASAATVLLQQSAPRIANMVADWIRVGFAQGNFNADNCLVAGRTMDYGPFGWMEEYHPLFAKWTGSGQHFGFLNQPSAGLANYQVLVESVIPVICAARPNCNDPEELVNEFMEPASAMFQGAVDAALRRKLGFRTKEDDDDDDNDIGDNVWQALEPLLRKSRTDWTLFFRELTYLMRDYPNLDADDYENMLT